MNTPATSGFARTTPAAGDRPAQRISAGVQIINLVAVVAPLLGLVGAVGMVWGWGFHWVDLGLLLGMYVITGLGVTVGYHRLFTHRAFETNRVVEFALAVLGAMAVQGPLLKWVAMHRVHHRYSDTGADPHSPRASGWGWLAYFGGLWHAHLGWIFKADPPNLSAYVKDLRESRAVRVASALFPLWIALGLLIPAALGALLMQSWTGALCGLIWGGLVRIFLVHHVIWSVNSVCHAWGTRPFTSCHDQSRNNPVFGILALGEGWHNNHHAFPTSARHGLRWWEIDVSYWFIRGLELCRLAWNVKLPTTPRRLAGE